MKPATVLNGMDRAPYEEAILNMLSNRRMADKHFYGFILAKCKVHLDPSTKTAGVAFENGMYHLFIGEKFNEWSLDERIAVLVHEARHILHRHVFRKGERNHRLFNMASDIAMNQTISNLPKGKFVLKKGRVIGGALYPDTFGFANDLTSEQYYELLVEEKKKQEKEKKEWEDKNPDKKKDKKKDKEERDCDGDCENPGNSGNPGDCESPGSPGEQGEKSQESGGGSEKESPEGAEEKDQNNTDKGNADGNNGENEDEEESGWAPSNGNPDITGVKEVTIDDHGKWDEVDKADEDLARAVTESMVKSAIANSRGNLPGDIKQILELWTLKSVVSWKKEIRRIIASKSGRKVSTIKRRDRRQPHRDDLRGKKTSKDKHVIVVGIDTSGSMNDNDILKGLVEIAEVVKTTGSDLQIIQIDTDIKDIQVFDRKKPTFQRHGYGGTYMGAIVPFIKEKRLEPDLLIMISDMEIEDVSNDENWGSFKPATIWLSARGLIPSWKKKGHKVIDIKNA